jgi:hypothetical protein
MNFDQIVESVLGEAPVTPPVRPPGLGNRPPVSDLDQTDDSSTDDLECPGCHRRFVKVNQKPSNGALGCSQGVIYWGWRIMRSGAGDGGNWPNFCGCCGASIFHLNPNK